MDRTLTLQKCPNCGDLIDSLLFDAHVANCAPGKASRVAVQPAAPNVCPYCRSWLGGGPAYLSASELPGGGLTDEQIKQQGY